MPGRYGPPIAQTDDLFAEGHLFHDVVIDAIAAQLEATTPFAGWCGVDVVAHLAYLDRMAVLLFRDEGAYDAEFAAFSEATAGASAHDVFARISAFERTRIDVSDPSALVERWWTGLGELCDVLAEPAASDQVRWFGRPMTVHRLAAARQMEVFAYGQDVVDLLRVERPPTDRLRPVADFGVRAIRFSFANRGLTPPDTPPRVRLDAPSGATWEWGGDETAPSSVVGAAHDFCLVATQRRHVDDTGLRVTGVAARTWMEISQCIAGPPLDGPTPGERRQR